MDDSVLWYRHAIIRNGVLDLRLFYALVWSIFAVDTMGALSLVFRTTALLDGVFDPSVFSFFDGTIHGNIHFGRAFNDRHYPAVSLSAFQTRLLSQAASQAPCNHWHTHKFAVDVLLYSIQHHPKLFSEILFGKDVVFGAVFFRDDCIVL